MKQSKPSKRHRSCENGSIDAFALLMNGCKKQKADPRKSLSSSSTTGGRRFVLCPGGCGMHVAEIDVNTHLDSCLQQQQNTQQGKTLPRLENVSTGSTRNLNKKVTTTNTSLKRLSKRFNFPKKDSPSHVSEPGQGDKNDAFAHMMKRSVEVFARSSTEPQKLWQRFHLCENGTVTLTCYDSYGTLEGATSTSITASPMDEEIHWTATVQVKDRPSPTTEPKTDHAQRIIELIVSSSFPMAPTADEKPKQLVQRHSRLSVPVLKSILQKSIRRRRPLPSVRVAMELVDKSLGDLLRRLPIIVFEDSSLHPDVPLVVWMMVAHSKGFILPPSLVTRLMQIVFEIASCPFQDICNEEEETLKSNSVPRSATTTMAREADELFLSLASFHRLDKTICLCTEDRVIWSILLRARYGGMAGDMKMLHSFAKSWKRRFSEETIPVYDLPLPDPALSTKKSPTTKTAAAAATPKVGTSGMSTSWKTLPSRLNQGLHKQSVVRVEELCKSGPLLKLSPADLAIEGVDFHCSPILGALMADYDFVQECLSRLAETSGTACDAQPGPLTVQDGTSGQQQRSLLEDVLRRCMWKYSAGVNYRRTLMTIAHHEDYKAMRSRSNPPNDPMKKLWDDVISAKAKAYSRRYIQERVAF